MESKTKTFPWMLEIWIEHLSFSFNKTLIIILKQLLLSKFEDGFVISNLFTMGINSYLFEVRISYDEADYIDVSSVEFLY